MITFDVHLWRSAARHFWHGRKLAREQEIRLKQRLWAEHEKRVALVNALSDLLPRMAVVGSWCRVCDSAWAGAHRSDCAYFAALAALRKASQTTEERR